MNKIKTIGMNFNQLSEKLFGVETTQSRLQITEHIADILQAVSRKETEMVCNLMLGRLYARFITMQFNIAEKQMISICASFLNLSIDQVKKDWKQQGDLGTFMRSHHWKSTENPSVTFVYQRLVDIEKISGIGSIEKKAEAIHALFSKVTPLSASYIVRLIVGKLRLGFSDMTLIDALSFLHAGDKSLKKEIETAYAKVPDIGRIATILQEEGIAGIKKMVITIGTPLLPAAAERMKSAQAIFEKIGPCVVQPKLDGFRLQIHYQKKKGAPASIIFFSRNIQDMSSMFPDLTDAFSSFREGAFIVEGEAIVYDAGSNTFLPFQETVQRRRKHNIQEVSTRLPLHIFLFDLLYYNGKSFLCEPHQYRRRTLRNLCAIQCNERIHVIREASVTIANQLHHYFLQQIEQGLEGVVAKRPDGKYQLGKRSFNWIKLKRTHGTQLNDTIDCIIMGYYIGKGRRTPLGIGALLAGVYDASEKNIVSIAKIGTGCTDEQWRTIKKMLDQYKQQDMPRNVVCDKTLHPDVWVLPEIVIAVYADEITRSPVHSAGKTTDALGYALRFPRFIDYRRDKDVQTATTVSEIKKLYRLQGS